MAAAEPSRSPQPWEQAGARVRMCWESGAWVAGGVGGHGPEPPCLEMGAFPSGVGPQGPQWLRAQPIHPPSSLQRPAAGTAHLPCPSPASCVLSKWWEMKLTAPLEALAGCSGEGWYGREAVDR